MALTALLGAAVAHGQERAEAPMRFVSPAEGARRATEAPDRAPLGPVRGEGAASVAWQFLGPQPIANDYYSGFGTSGGFAAGRVCALAIDPGNAQTVYAAAAQGGVWKTTDGGVNWTALTDGLSSLASGALALDPQDPTVVWYGTGEQNLCIDCAVGDGLFRSTNGGAAWSKVAAKTSVGGYIARIAIAPTASSIMLVASERGIVRSVNGGSSWSVVLGGSYGTDVAFDTGVSPTAYAAIYGLGIYKSTDLGASWSPVYAPAPNTVGRINFAVAPSAPGTLYASVVNASTYGLFALQRSTDFGATWSTLSVPDYLTGKSNNGQGFYDNALTVDPLDANTIVVGGSDPVNSAQAVLYSNNAGASWSGRAIGVDTGRVHPDHHALAFGSDGVLWDANDGGIWCSGDAGLHWINRNATLGITQFYSVALDPADGTTRLGGTQDNGTIRSDASTTWTQVISGDGGPCFFDPASPTTLYTSYVFLRPLLRWAPAQQPVDVTGGAAHDWSGDPVDWANGVFAPDPNVSGTFWAGTNRLWLSANSGTTWSAVTGSLARTPGGVLRAIGFGLGAPHAIYAGSSDGSLYVTTDTSAVYWNRSAGLPTRPIPDILVYPSQWSSAYVCADTTAGGRVFNTATDGRAWLNVTGDLPSGVRPLSMTADFRATPPSLFLGTDHGVYFSVNGGAHWALTGLPAVAVYDLALDMSLNVLVAATHGRGMWSLPLGITRAPAADEVAAVDGSVLRGVRAGRESAGSVRFTLGASAPVHASVFAVDGRRVATITWPQAAAGAHEWSWGAQSQAPSGVFRVCVEAAGTTRTTWSVRLR